MFFSTNEIVDTQFLFIQTFHNSLFDASWRIVDVNGRADDRAPKGAVVVSVFATAMELAAQRGGYVGVTGDGVDQRSPGGGGRIGNHRIPSRRIRPRPRPS